MASVFISYARADGRTLADRLAADLERNGHDPWLDRSEIQGGEEWSREIEAAIDGCDVLLAVLTHGSYDSRICRGEQARALRKKKLVVPLLGQADAERPLYLESANYLDFSDPSSFAASFARLLEAIAQGSGFRVEDMPQQRRDRLTTEGQVQSMAAAIHDGTADWPQIVSLAAEQRNRFFDVLTPRRDGIGTFEPSLYVPRAAVEAELARFIHGSAPGLVLIGDSGAGKTNVLCSWAQQQAADGHGVLMYHCDKLTSCDVERELMRDLGLEDADAIPDALAAVDELAGREGRRMVVVFDGINRFRGRQSELPGELLSGIDELIARLAGTNFRIVLSCSTPAWTRLERLGATRLSWNRYHRSESDEEMLVLSDFDEHEAAAAYEKYRQHFKLKPDFLDLPAALRLRLRDPLLLRFFAETSGGMAITSEDPVLDTLIQRYLADRLRLRADQLFVDELVGEMHARNRAALPVRSLTTHPVLGPAVLDEGPDSSYSRLLDAGLLVQVEGDGLFVDDLVRFAYPLIGAYALAGRLVREAAPLEETILDLIEKAEELTFAWEAAAIMLAARGSDESLVALAGSARLELRELAADSLVRLHATDAKRIRNLLLALLDGDATEAQRTALRVAYSIGPATRDLFMHAAMSSSDELRQTVRDILYLIWSGQTRGIREPTATTGYFLWRQAPGFTYDLMRDMVARVSWVRPRSARKILRFVLDLAITIYVNHCDREDVAKQTAELYYELTVNRLHLDRIRLGSRLEHIVLRVVAAVFSKRILDWILTDDGNDPDAFFGLPPAQRAILVELAPLLDPDSDFRSAEDLIGRALASDVGVFRGAATLVSAIHAHAHFDRNEAVLRRLFERLDGRGKLWQMIGMSVLLPATPVTWIPLLEDCTRALLAGQPDPIPGQGGLTREMLFLPLGLAYGKRGEGMPLFDELLADGLARDEQSGVVRLVTGLGPVGFYYPHPVLSTLRPHREALMSQPAYRQALISALGTIRTLHVDRVDAFLMQAAADEAFHRRVAATADVELVHRFVHALGYYNNAVHYCLRYPRMRRDLGVFALELLARTDSGNDFIVGYAQQGIAMARSAGFNLLQWTLPLDI